MLPQAIQQPLEIYFFERLLLTGHYELAWHHITTSPPSLAIHYIILIADAFLKHKSELRHSSACKFSDEVQGMLLDLYDRLSSTEGEKQAKEYIARLSLKLFFLRTVFSVSLSRDLRSLCVNRAATLCEMSHQHLNFPWLYRVLEWLFGNIYFWLNPNLQCHELSNKQRCKRLSLYLTWGVEAGLTTVWSEQQTCFPFSLCLQKDMYHEALLMYETGAATWQELEQHRHELEVRPPPRPITLLNDFLMDVCFKSSQSLLNVCITTLSHWSGVGGEERKRRAWSLKTVGLPETLIRQILFEGPIARYQQAVGISDLSSQCGERIDQSHI